MKSVYISEENGKEASQHADHKKIQLSKGGKAF